MSDYGILDTKKSVSNTDDDIVYFAGANAMG